MKVGSQRESISFAQLLNESKIVISSFSVCRLLKETMEQQIFPT